MSELDLRDKLSSVSARLDFLAALLSSRGSHLSSCMNNDFEDEVIMLVSDELSSISKSLVSSLHE